MQSYPVDCRTTQQLMVWIYQKRIFDPLAGISVAATAAKTYRGMVRLISPGYSIVQSAERPNLYLLAVQRNHQDISFCPYPSFPTFHLFETHSDFYNLIQSVNYLLPCCKRLIDKQHLCFPAVDRRMVGHSEVRSETWRATQGIVARRNGKGSQAQVVNENHEFLSGG